MDRDYGSVSDYNGNTVNVVTRPQSPISLKDGLIGFGFMVLGGVYLCVNAFRKGGKATMTGEYDALNKLGLIDNTDRGNVALDHDKSLPSKES